MKGNSIVNYVGIGCAVTIVGIAMAMVQYKVPTVLTPIMASYSLDAAGGSWLMSIFTLMMVFFAIPSSALAQRIGARRVMILSCCVIVAGSLVGIASSDATVLLVSRGIEGIAVAAVTVCAPVVIENSVSADRLGSALGIWGTWGPLGSTFAALITPTLFYAFGMTVLWLAYSAVVVVATLIMVAVVKPTLGHSVAHGTGDAKPRYRELYTKNMALFFSGFIAFNISMLAVLSFVPTILQMRGADPTLSGFVSIVPMILSIVSCPVFGLLSDRTGKTKLLLVIAVACLGPCAFLLYTQQGAAMWFAAILMGLVGMGSSGLIITAFMKVLPRPELKTIGMGMLITVQGVGQFLGTFLVQILLGPELDRVVLAGAVIMVLVLLGAAALSLAKFEPLSQE